MPAHATVATLIETRRVASEHAFIILVSAGIKDEEGALVETIRFCKNPVNIEFPTGSGTIYEAANFEIDVSYEANEQPRVSFTANDVTGIIRERMEAYGGAVGSDVTVTVVNTDALDQPPEFQETFEIIGAKAPPGFKVAFSLGSENPLALRFPRNLQYRDRCPYQYKGARCGYAGAMASCDYTLDGANGCRAHSNIANFGGFPALRNIQT